MSNYPSREALQRLGHDGFALTKAQALAMHDEIDTLWDNLAARELEVSAYETALTGREEVIDNLTACVDAAEGLATACTEWCGGDESYLPRRVARALAPFRKAQKALE